MKIFNIEDNKEKMYMQVEDVKLLVLNKDTPRTISNIICNITFNDEYTDDQFICFDREEDVEFLKKQTWNVDFREYKNKSISEINKEIIDLNKRSKNLDLNNKADRRSDVFLQYRLVNLYDLIAIKEGIRKINFPLVKDYIGMDFKSPDGRHVMYETLDPNKVVLQRTDGTKLSRIERISQCFLENGLSVALSNKIEHNETVEKYRINSDFSEDMMYYISEFECNLKKKKEEDKKGFKSLIKKLFK